MQPIVQMRDVWTVADLESLDVEDWRRYEIVDGALVVSPPPNVAHEVASEEVRAAIRSALDGSLIVLGPVGIEFGRSSYRIPDLVVVARERARRRPGLLDPTDVLIVVEIVSPGSVTTDRITKPAQYAGARIASYWRVETDPVSITAYELPAGADTYREVGTWGTGETARIDRPFPVMIDVSSLSP